MGPRHGREVAVAAEVPLSLAAGTFELPVGAGWVVDRAGGAALPLPMAAGTFLLSVG